MKRIALLLTVAVALFSIQAQAGEHGKGHDRPIFKPGSLLLSRSIYGGDASTVTVGQTLPPGCKAGTVTLPVIGGGKTTVKVACATAVADGTYPGVFANDRPDSSFGITSAIYLDNLGTDGTWLSTYDVPTDRLVTSFSSKSELALNVSTDGDSITFVGYHGGNGFKTDINQLDVSNSNTPGVIDPTNPVTSQYYRAVAELDAFGNLSVTDGNAYSGNNGRAAIKGGELYYMAGNDNNGGLKAAQLIITQVGLNLIASTGAEMLIPGNQPPLPPNIDKIGDFEIDQAGYAAPDKPGKDNNFRGLTIFDSTLYVTKGSGGNGINTVYQVGQAGQLPDGTTAELAAEPITILPGFPTSLASGVDQQGNPATPSFPFGIWFADADTLYVCDEGDGVVVDPPVDGNVATDATRATAGVQKWVRGDDGTWSLAYVLNDGLDIGVPYDVPNYPADIAPATGGCRNLTGKTHGNGRVDIYAVTSTLSHSGDQGADPNRLVTVSDILHSREAPHANGNDPFGHFATLRTAVPGEVLRGVSFAPGN